MLQERERLAKAAKAAEGRSEEGEKAEPPAGLRHSLVFHSTTQPALLRVPEHLQRGS